MDRRYDPDTTAPDLAAARGPAAGEWLVAGGEAAELIRSLDWSATPLGPRASWPESLRAVVNVVLASRVPMALAWGRELVLVYNDAYRAIAGGKHPSALGRSTREVWPEVWHVTEPIYASVIDRGETVCLEDARFAIDRHGYDEDAYFTLCYSPVRIEAGTVGGALVTLQETTAQVADRRRVADEQRRYAAEADAVLGSVADGVLVYDAEGRILRTNAAADALLGFDPGDHGLSASDRAARTGVEWLDERGRRVDPQELPAVRAARHGETHRGVVLRMRSGRRERWLSVTAAPITGVAPGEAVASITDITALKQAEDRYRALAENAPEVIARFDRQLRHTYVNAYGAKVYGVPPDQVVGKTNADLGMPADKVAFWKRNFEEVFATGEQRTVEFDFEGPSFGKQSFSSLFVPERDDTGEVASVLAITRDVTPQKRAEEAARAAEEDARARAAQLEAILGAVADGVVVYDRTGRTLRSTPAADELLGISAGERAAPVHERVERQYEVLDESGRRIPREEMIAYRAAVKGESARDQVLSVRPLGGKQRWLRLNAVPFFLAGRHAGAVLSMTDISDRKRAEEARDRAAAALREANAHLQEADRRKDEFLGMLSHELRNPLAPIRNSLYILDHAEPDGQQARRAKETASRQLAHLTRLVDDLLDVTRIARGKIELRRAELDLAALARRTAEDHRQLMQDRHVDLALELPDTPVLVDGDETRLAQVVGNLLHNAAKFTPAGGRVTLSVTAAEPDAVLRVRDTGAGIEPDMMRAIFEPFTQAKQTLARSEGGLGLGLALVKGLVGLHGGDVSATSEGRGRGTEFAVTLPLAAAHGDRSSSGRPAPVGAGAERRRILVIDDNRDAADSLAELVSMMGHDAEVAYDAFDGLARVADAIPDVVLCDIGLPGMDGYEFARQFRALESTHCARLVAVSGYAQPEDVARAVDAGFDDHVAKPPDPEKLAAVLGDPS